MPPVPSAGLPDRIPAADRVTPLGRVPAVMLKVGLGKPVARAVKVPDWPVVKVALSVDVMEGAWFTVRVKAWVASVPTPLDALIVIA